MLGNRIPTSQTLLVFHSLSLSPSISLLGLDHLPTPVGQMDHLGEACPRNPTKIFLQILIKLKKKKTKKLMVG